MAIDPDLGQVVKLVCLGPQGQFFALMEAYISTWNRNADLLEAGMTVTGTGPESF